MTHGPETGWFEGDTHVLPLRVYYEDTDTAGIVYYANWLRYLERGRTEFVRSMGFGQGALMGEDKWVAFAVRRLEIDYLKSARLDDVLVVRSAIRELKRASMIMAQSVHRDGVVLVDARVRIACIDRQGRPARPPRAIAAALPPSVAEAMRTP